MNARQIVCFACLIAFLPRISSLNQLLRVHDLRQNYYIIQGYSSRLVCYGPSEFPNGFPEMYLEVWKL